MISKIRRKLGRGLYRIADRMDVEVRHPAARYKPLVALKQLASERPVQVIFDVGANTGQTAQKFRQHFPHAYIHCFEPYPDAFEQLKATIAADTRTIAHQIALGDQDGKALLFVNSESPTNSFLPNTPNPSREGPHASIHTIDRTQTEMQTLASFCQQQKISTIDLLKIDTQGYELHVLRGAQSLLTSTCIRFIYLEVLFYPLYEMQAQFYDIQALLNQSGYRIFNFYEPAWSEQHGLLWADALFYGEEVVQSAESLRP